MAPSKSAVRKSRSQNRTAAMAGTAGNNNNAPPGDGTKLQYMKWETELQHKMLNAIDKAPYQIVICGKQSTDENTVRMTKKAVFEGVAREVIPQVCEINLVAAGTKVQTQWKAMKAKYDELNAKLVQTGGGIGGDDASDDDTLRVVELEEYVGEDGPNDQNTKEARNQWEQNIKDYPIFPRLHALFHHHPNQVPIATTTGIGPSGPRTVLYQPPSRSHSLERSSSLPPLPPRVRMPSPFRQRLPSSEWDAEAGPGARQPTDMAFPPIPADSDSEPEILVPASPPVEGNGKGVDPRERNAPVPKATKKDKGTVKVKEGKVKVKAKDGKEVKDMKGKDKNGEAKVKQEKHTPPQASKKLANAQAETTTPSGSTNNRKCKSGDDGLSEMMRDMRERHIHINEFKLRELNETSFRVAMDGLRSDRRDNPNMH